MALTIEVTNSNDAGVGSLRKAIEISNLIPDSLIILTSQIKDPIVLTTGEILVTSDVTITNKSCECIQVKSSNSRIFHLTANVKNFKLEGINRKSITLTGHTLDKGGAIFSESTGKIILIQVAIKDSSSSSGGAIYTAGSLILFESLLKKNQAQNQGAGIWAGGSVILNKSIVNFNQVTLSLVTSGGGGIFIDEGDLIANESSISNNTVNNALSGSGGAVIVMSGSIYLQNCSKINNNQACNTGGIQQGIGNVIIQGGSQLNYNKSTNTINPGGCGGLNITFGSVEVVDSQVSYNESVAMMAGGIVSLLGDVIVTRSQMIKNVTFGPGGAIATNFNSSLIITESEIRDNVGASLGGALMNFSPTTTGLISISNCKITHNTLTNNQTIGQTIKAFLSLFLNQFDYISQQAVFSGGPGGANYVSQIPFLTQKAIETNNALQNLPATISGFPLDSLIAGGAVASLLPCPIVITNSEVSNNFAGEEASQVNIPFHAIGGGVFAAGPTEINWSGINNNKAIDLGGGIYSSDNLTMTKTELKENIQGGLFNNGVATLIDCCVLENKTSGLGGGIFNTGDLTLISSVVKRNVAVMGGGVYSTSPFTSIDSRIKNNIPDNVVIV